MNDNKKYDPSEVAKVIDNADIRDFIPGCDPHKREQKTECPFCHSKNLSVVHKAGKNFAHCFECGKSLHDAVAALREYEGLGFLEALEAAAARSGIHIEPRERRREQRLSDAMAAAAPRSFCARQLADSGLEMEDVLARTLDKQGREEFVVTFRRGGVSPGFVPNETDDDMLIYYYGLDGRPVTYIPRGGGGRPKPYFRARWSNPDAHASQSGKAGKYCSPAGAPSQVYIPQAVREKFQARARIETLFLQEGEKKAEKACKHGMLSVGLQGINNFGSQETGIAKEIQYIVKECGVRDLVLVMDSDWRDLQKNITTGDSITRRPNSFAKAVIKFKQFARSLHNLELSVDVWWGHVNANPAGDKGVDDLLCGTLKGREGELARAAEEAMHAHDGHSDLIDIHKITTLTDRRIEDFWLLNDHQAFYDLHKERLADIGTFKIGATHYRVEDGKLAPLSRYSSESDIWKITTDSKGGEKVGYNVLETFELLDANGFFRLEVPQTDGTTAFDLIRVGDDGIIDRVTPIDIREFVRSYVKETCKKYIVLEFFAARLDTLLSDKKLEPLKRVKNDFNQYKPDVQRLFYNNGAVEITADGITPGIALNKVWRSAIVPRKFRRVEVVKNIEKGADGRFRIDLSEAGEKCDFMRYIFNTSNSFHAHDEKRELSPEERAELRQHIVNKITAIGYLLCGYKYPSEKKAVVVQDHRMAEVGQSHGGSGKSMLGQAVAQVIPQTMIDGKDDGDTRFMFQRVTADTRNIFIDDVKTNFDFERLFPMITNDMVVERKQIAPLHIPSAQSPKILLTTNHALNKAEEAASRRRIIYVEVSEWYGPDHTIVSDFGRMFFDDWDAEQWELFDNFMAECVMYYLRSFRDEWTAPGAGAVPPPMKNIQLRTLRQEMSEIFYQWAEEYFDPTGTRLNQRVARKDMVAAFEEYAGNQRHGVTRSNFRKKLEAYCKFKGFDLNPDRQNKDKKWCSDWKATHPGETFIGGDDKSGGLEYLTVTAPDTD